MRKSTAGLLLTTSATFNSLFEMPTGCCYALAWSYPWALSILYLRCVVQKKLGERFNIAIDFQFSI